ncbi:bacteriophage transposase [Neisseria mucosa]|nr:bacteriophage transposase [Neisseria mucosa]
MYRRNTTTRPHGELPRHPDRRALYAEGLSGNEAGTGRYRAGYVVGGRAGDDVYGRRKCEKYSAVAGLFNNSYFSVELAEYHKDEVRVSYDLDDASVVNVFDMDGKFITKAQVNGNSREAFPTARIDQLAEKRRKGKIKRAENAIKLANAEVNPALEQAAAWDELGHLGGNVIKAEYAVLPKTGTDDEIVLFEADM